MRFLESLGIRVVAMLSVALLPVGLIALYQTNHVVEQAEELARGALLGATLSAVESESDLIHEGFAAARVLGGALRPIRTDTEACSDLMRGFIRAHPAYSLATYVNADGISTCNSRGAVADLRRSDTYRQMLDQPRPRMSAVEKGRISETSVILISQPVFDEADYIGHVSLSLSRDNITALPVSEAERRPLNVINLNDEGQIMWATSDIEEAQQQLPAYRDLSSFLYRRATTFSATDRAGASRIYTLVPIVPGVAFTIAVWSPEAGSADPGFISRAALAFPVLMWLVSLIVAYIAVHRLVIRHVRTLRTKMRHFGSGSSAFASYALSDSTHAPAELKQMEETFDSMVERITRDTAELENGLHEKNVLLKEVHHRVKNNLQLIASIMNMEIRKARSPETRSTLRRVQDRVMGLATVHSNLYHTSRLASLRADSLLDDILHQTLKSALPSDNSVDVEIRSEEVILYPDQAVPLSLLATEAATNAIKYLGRPASGAKPWIRISLLRTSEESFRFCMENSRGAPLDLREEAPEGTGLGNQLISAFAMQLGAKAEVEQTEDAYSLCVDVKVRNFAREDER